MCDSGYTYLFFSQVQGRVSTAASSNNQKTGVEFCQMHFSELSRESCCKQRAQSTVGTESQIYF